MLVTTGLPNQTHKELLELQFQLAVRLSLTLADSRRLLAEMREAIIESRELIAQSRQLIAAFRDTHAKMIRGYPHEGEAGAEG